MKRLPKDCWLTADNRQIKISEMTDQHLLNTIGYINNNPTLYENRADQYVKMLEEAKRRGLK